MDYEKKYNEALERATKIHDEILNNELLGFPDQIREIFPELRGSEDERIRKWLVDYFSSIKATVWVHRDITCEQILEWLEKQKENPKNADSIPEDCASLAKCEERNSKYGVFPEDVIVVARACEKLEAHGYPELAHALKNVNLYTKEQKPVEKQDYSGLNDLERAILRGFLCAGVENVPVTIIKETARDCLAQMKPAEWSDYKDKIDIPYCSSEQEWSEEDEKMLKCCLIAINHYEKTCNIGDHRPTKFNIDGYLAYVDKVKSWLKSLRPSWKPSEEQMKALEIAFRKDGDDKYRSTINSLYNDLKKL